MGFSPILILAVAILSTCFAVMIITLPTPTTTVCGWIVAVAGIGSLQAANWVRVSKQLGTKLHHHHSR